ncbi:hypothetical protein C4D60_Mb06t26370 [Musa balbisiana]|uniref:Succinate dehydrogenase subunit 5, mitochondrial n=1 Tax=Musa balbisiana TaxID=52838 RepID=A0A4S8IQY6_MUSBA|nr:hypothetical protein C4D60_Mb06t26370 [Musa balbisiana]
MATSSTAFVRRLRTLRLPSLTTSSAAFVRHCSFIGSDLQFCSLPCTSPTFLLIKLRTDEQQLRAGAGGNTHDCNSSRNFRPQVFVCTKFEACLSSKISQLPVITDPDIKAAMKDLLAINWDEIPDPVINETKKALSKTTEDKAGQEALANVFRAAEASVEFSGVLVSLRMALDDLCGLSACWTPARGAAYKQYITYLDSFGPDETFLRKKVELELGTKMIHLKMRCSGIGSEWGKVTLLGTSGLSGSYVDLRS